MLYCVPQLYSVTCICILIWAVLTGELEPVIGIVSFCVFLCYQLTRVSFLLYGLLFYVFAYYWVVVWMSVSYRLLKVIARRWTIIVKSKNKNKHKKTIGYIQWKKHNMKSDSDSGREHVRRMIGIFWYFWFWWGYEEILRGLVIEW